MHNKKELNRHIVRYCTETRVDSTDNACFSFQRIFSGA